MRKEYFKAVLCLVLASLCLWPDMSIKSASAEAEFGNGEYFNTFSYNDLLISDGAKYGDTKLLDKPYSGSFKNQLSDDEREIYETIENNINLMRKNEKMYFKIPINGTYYANDEDDMTKLRYKIWNAVFAFEYDRPDLFWLSKRHKFDYNQSDNHKITALFLIAVGGTWHNEEFPTYESVLSAEKRFNAAIKEIAGEAKKLGYYSRVKYIFEYVLDNCQYNQYVSNGDGMDELGEMPWSAYSAIIKQTNPKKFPVCEAYAKEFMLLCKEADMEAALVSGKVGDANHMWVALRMHNQRWFYTDPTFADSYENGGYSFFLRSKQDLQHHIANGQLVESMGELSFPDINEKSYPQGIGDKLGDCNMDKEVNTSDAVAILRHVTGLETLSKNKQLYADFNVDDNINTADAVSLLRFCAM